MCKMAKSIFYVSPKSGLRHLYANARHPPRIVHFPHELRPFDTCATQCIPLLELLDEVLCWKVITIFVLTKCGVVLSLIFVALVFGFPDCQP